MFETNQEKAKEMPKQEQGQDQATAYKRCQPLAADFRKCPGFHGLFYNF
jgi:hypothetical protein